MDEVTKKRGGGLGKFLLFLFIAAVAMGTFAAYHWGTDTNAMVNGRYIDELQPWEVVGGVILGTVGLIMGLIGGAIGIIVALIATAIAIGLALIGILVPMFLVAGVVLGPFLLLALIIVMVRRNGRPEVV